MSIKQANSQKYIVAELAPSAKLEVLAKLGFDLHFIVCNELLSIFFISELLSLWFDSKALN